VAGEGAQRVGDLPDLLDLAVVAVEAVSIVITASRCPAFSPVRSTAARACSPVTSCGIVRLAAARICCSVSRWASAQYRSSFGGR